LTAQQEFDLAKRHLPALHRTPAPRRGGLSGSTLKPAGFATLPNFIGRLPQVRRGARIEEWICQPILSSPSQTVDARSHQL
jgi:hypothetical protein